MERIVKHDKEIESLKKELEDCYRLRFKFIDDQVGVISGKDKEIEYLRSVLLKLEWSGIYSYCTGWPCCPICKGIKPGHGRDEHGTLPDNSGHRAGCALDKVI